MTCKRPMEAFTENAGPLEACDRWVPEETAGVPGCPHVVTLHRDEAGGGGCLGCDLDFELTHLRSMGKVIGSAAEQWAMTADQQAARGQGGWEYKLVSLDELELNAHSRSGWRYLQMDAGARFAVMERRLPS